MLTKDTNKQRGDEQMIIPNELPKCTVEEYKYHVVDKRHQTKTAKEQNMMFNDLRKFTAEEQTFHVGVMI